jgi:hypothetical protein
MGVVAAWRMHKFVAERLEYVTENVSDEFKVDPENMGH